MSNHHLRKDKICQDCGQEVLQRYCPACGQENTETRQSFGHLIKHFVEDLVHYDGSFWKTLKHLICHPGYLSQKYLEGKRTRYVAPVKLYIFVSFFSFLILHFCPDFNTFDPDSSETAAAVVSQTTAEEDSPSYKKLYEQYIAHQQSLARGERDGALKRKFAIKLFTLETLSDDVVQEKVSDEFEKNFPKALFFFMPLFAFFLWLFLPKKKYLFFDHGIFTLHYFSFSLLAYTGNDVLDSLIPWNYLFNSELISDGINLLTAIWLCYYFVRAFNNLYRPSGLWNAFLKPALLWFLEFLLFLLLFLFLIIYSMPPLDV